MVSWGPIHRLYSDWWPKQSGWTSLKIKVGVQRVYWTSAVWTCLCNQIFVTSEPKHILRSNVKTDFHVFALLTSHLCWSMQLSVKECLLQQPICVLVLLDCVESYTQLSQLSFRFSRNRNEDEPEPDSLPTLMTTPLPGPVLKIGSQSCETVDTNW